MPSGECENSQPYFHNCNVDGPKSWVAPSIENILNFFGDHSRASGKSGDHQCRYFVLYPESDNFTGQAIQYIVINGIPRRVCELPAPLNRRDNTGG